jgi:hypothetical protein
LGIASTSPAADTPVTMTKDASNIQWFLSSPHPGQVGAYKFIYLQDSQGNNLMLNFNTQNGAIAPNTPLQIASAGSNI